MNDKGRGSEGAPFVVKVGVVEVGVVKVGVVEVGVVEVGRTPRRRVLPERAVLRGQESAW